MKHNFVIRGIQSLTGAVLFLTFASVAQATTHIVEFGGPLGDTYSPSSLSVSVGDTVQWQGDFSAHPLSSTSVPPGAASFHQSSGTVFNYVVTAAGTYTYQCDFHSSLGMTGTITAIATGVENTRISISPVDFRLGQNYPNPFNPTTTIKFSIGKSSIVDVKIFDLLGREVETLVHGEMNAGMHEVRFDASKFASGIYFYRLQAGEFSAVKKLVLLK